MNDIIELNDIVKTPFDNVGIVREIKNIPWGHKYIVEVLKNTAIHNSGDVEDFKEEQLIKVIL